MHHVAFATEPQDQEAWRERVAESGEHPTPIIDRFYFRSVYFREPSGVLFEIATIGPGFAVDEDADHLGERLSLPPRFEPLREHLVQHAHAAALPARRRFRLKLTSTAGRWPDRRRAHAHRCARLAEASHWTRGHAKAATGRWPDCPTTPVARV